MAVEVRMDNLFQKRKLELIANNRIELEQYMTNLFLDSPQSAMVAIILRRPQNAQIGQTDKFVKARFPISNALDDVHQPSDIDYEYLLASTGLGTRIEIEIVLTEKKKPLREQFNPDTIHPRKLERQPSS